MRKTLIILLMFLAPSGFLRVAGTSVAPQSPCRYSYDRLHLDDKLSFSVFRMAYEGYVRIGQKKNGILALIDYSKPSTEKRLFVIDMERTELLYTTHVAHGRGSGDNYATSFSNVNGSHKSSLGFFLTDDTYIGRNGYSLRLDGLERGINDKARERAIVIHGADYADPRVARDCGRLGRSFGCPALPPDVARELIDTIKDGAVLFIYAADTDYARSSKYNVITNTFGLAGQGRQPAATRGGGLQFSPEGFILPSAGCGLSPELTHG